MAGPAYGAAVLPRAVRTSASAVAAVLAGALTLALVACGGTASVPYPRGPVEIATGGTQGVYYGYGQALADALGAELDGVDARVLATAGSVENLRRVAEGSSTVGFTAADAAADAVAGEGLFGRPQPVRALARVYDDYVHLVVRADSPVRTAAQLRGQRVSLGSAGSGTELIAGRVLAVLRLDPVRDVRAVRLGINESVAALRAGTVDAFFWSGGLPTGGVAELAAGVPVRLVDLGRYAPDLRSRFNRAYRAAAVPAGTYPGVPALLTVAVANYLVVAEDADQGLVYQLTRVLFEQREVLARRVPLAGTVDPRAAIETGPVPLHPGALRYYRAVKR